MNGYSELAGLISSKRYNTRTCITLSKGPAWVKVFNFDNNGWNAALLDVYIHKRNGTSAMHSKSIIQFDVAGNVKLEGDSGVVGYVVNGGKISIYIKSLYTETSHVFFNLITDAEKNNIPIVEYPLTEPDGIIYL